MTYSPVKGPEGNIEFLAHLSQAAGPDCGCQPEELVRQAHAAL